MNEPNNELNIKWLCETAGVSRSGYYKWRNNAKLREDKEARDRADFDIILEAYKYRGIDKGVQGIHMRLLHQKPPRRMNHKNNCWNNAAQESFFGHMKDEIGDRILDVKLTKK